MGPASNSMILILVKGIGMAFYIKINTKRKKTFYIHINMKVAIYTCVETYGYVSLYMNIAIHTKTDVSNITVEKEDPRWRTGEVYLRLGHTFYLRTFNS